MLFRQSLEPRADTVELIDFAQDRCKRHRQTAFSLKSLRWENFRMDWLRSEDLKEEKDVTAPTFIVAGTSDQN
jgi:alpha-beta hydrolase superfamily lysophospholipase